ncbi:MAG: DUF2867 domain-containing protein [Desulfobacterales bacterium]|nr:MAG: DUF2867 domain-containing protein [Desulfobacterales bacterium]
MNYIKHYPEITSLINGADHTDVKTVEGQVSLQQFIASMLSYYPWWIIFLYHVRAVFVRILGMRQPAMPDELPKLLPEDVPMTPGENATFFILRHTKEEEYWIAETPEEKHLRAYFGVVVEPVKDSLKRFHVVTIVHYKHWTGPVYFNTIRPFHHLVVRRMARAGVKL